MCSWVIRALARALPGIGGGGLSWAEKGVFLLAPTAFLSGYLRSSTSKTCWQSSRGLSLLPPTHSFQKTDGLGVTGNGV